jgi:hypothetical protein
MWKPLAGVVAVACSSTPANADEPPTRAEATPVPAAAAAECPEPVRSLEGKYGYSGGEAERKALEDAVDDVVSEMNPFVREIARRRLLAANEIAQTLEVQVEGAHVTVAFDERSYTAELGGPAVKVTGVTGKRLSLTHRLKGDKLVQKFDGAGGGRTNVFDNNDQRVRINVKVSSDQLPKPLSYRLTFKRK